MLAWLGKALPCNDLMCVCDVLRQLKRASYQSATELFGGETDWDRTHYAALLMSLTGSRWYASLYMMHKDLDSLSSQLPADYVVRVAEEKGCKGFATMYRARAGGWKPSSPALVPWPWYPVTGTLSWDCARELLAAFSTATSQRRFAISPERMQHYASLVRGGYKETPKKAASPAVMRLAQMVREQNAERQRREKLIRYGVPLGILLLGGGATLYWYYTEKK
jgi:hypothetical protein